MFICIASGSSLTKEDVDYVRGKGKVYVVNDNYKLAPWADVLYAADDPWWDFHKGAPEFEGEKWTVSEISAQKWNLNLMSHDKHACFSNQKEAIALGGNSGFQCLNLAICHGAMEVVLLGYDMGHDGQKHWFGNHPKEIDRTSNYPKWIANFNKAAPYIRGMGVKVWNCSPSSRLECFAKANLREIL
jgi:hypothetical protein